MEIPKEIMDAAIPLVIAVVGWVYAYIQSGKADDAIKQTEQVTEYFSTGNAPAPTNTLIPAKSFKMKQSTKDWLLVSETEPDKVQIVNQIAEAEDAGKTEYTIVTSRGYYRIEWGALVGSGKFGQ